jgi:hypothetical protein
MASLQFTAKNDTGSKWGGEFSGSVKRCVEKQFKIGASEVTIIDNGKSTVFINSANSKPIIKMDYKPAVSSDANFKINNSRKIKSRIPYNFEGYDSLRIKAHLSYLTPLIAVAIQFLFGLIKPNRDNIDTMIVIRYIIGHAHLLLFFIGLWFLFATMRSLYATKLIRFIIPISISIVLNVPVAIIANAIIEAFYHFDAWKTVVDLFCRFT